MTICFFNKNLQINSKKTGFVLFVLILFLQFIALVNMGNQKDGMHIDEHYSFILSNSYDSPKISYDSQSWNQWLSGAHFEKFLEVEINEWFSYKSVYYNNSLDAHPPLYYFLLHTVCSLFPGRYTMWYGLALNIGIIIITQCILFFCTREITGSTLWGCVPVALFGATQAFFDITLFIRMYALLTMFSVLLVWKHYQLIMRTNKSKVLAECFLITFLGLFTQYYFLFLAFFLAAATCLYFVCKKEWKIGLLYAGGMIIAVILLFLAYPSAVTQITGSDTNNVGNAVMENIFDFSEWKVSFSSMLYQASDIILVGFRTSAVTLCYVGVAISFVLGKQHQGIKYKKPSDNLLKSYILIFIMTGVLLFAFGVISHISAEFNYVRYVYNLIPLFLLSISMLLFELSKTLKLNQAILALGVIISCVITTSCLVKNNACSYLYQERTEKDTKIIEMCDNRPLVLINNGSTYQPTALMHMITEANQVYLANYTEFSDKETCFSQVDCSNGVVFIVLTDQKWSKGYTGEEIMNKVVKESNCFEKYKKIGSCSFSTVYLAN